LLKTLQQGCHFGRLSGKSRPKDVCRTRPTVRNSRLPVDGYSTRRLALVDGLVLQWFYNGFVSSRRSGDRSGRLPPRPLGGAAVRIPTTKRSDRPAVGVAIRQSRFSGGVVDGMSSGEQQWGPRTSDTSASVFDGCPDAGQPYPTASFTFICLASSFGNTRATSPTIATHTSTLSHVSGIGVKWNLYSPPKPLIVSVATFCF
jgi:hypothetical protein